jgi:HAD superfamily hydrolase (TIGR01509 family)
VIFDLWETLIDWDVDAATLMNERIDARTAAGFRERWYAAPNRYTAPVREVLAAVGVPAEAMPRTGAVDTLRRLRADGYRVGLITVCTEDVELLWPESEFAGLFDAEVFSNAVGLSKPDPRIYLHCCELLGVEPAEALFVGDGANDELAGAERVGMRSILIHKPGEDPLWPEVREWDGLRVTSIPQVLEVLEQC